MRAEQGKQNGVPEQREQRGGGCHRSFPVPVPLGNEMICCCCYMGCCVRNGDIFALYFLSAAVDDFLLEVQGGELYPVGCRKGSTVVDSLIAVCQGNSGKYGSYICLASSFVERQGTAV